MLNWELSVVDFNSTSILFILQLELLSELPCKSTFSKTFLSVNFINKNYKTIGKKRVWNGIWSFIYLQNVQTNNIILQKKTGPIVTFTKPQAVVDAVQACL